MKFLSIKPKSKQASVDDMTKAPSNAKSKGLTKEISKVLADSLRQLGNSRLPRDSKRKSLDVKEEEESEGEEEGVSSEESEKADDSEEEEEEACAATAVTTTTVTASARGTKNKALQLSGKNTCDTQKWATGGRDARHILLTNSQEKQSRNKVGSCRIMYVI